mgnify:CR=1 FL=1
MGLALGTVLAGTGATYAAAAVALVGRLLLPAEAEGQGRLLSRTLDATLVMLLL